MKAGSNRGVDSSHMTETRVRLWLDFYTDDFRIRLDIDFFYFERVDIPPHIWSLELLLFEYLAL